MRHILYITATLALLLRGVAFPGTYEGTVVRIVDGDTIVAEVAGKELSVRMTGVDCPEYHRGRKFRYDSRFDCCHTEEELLEMGREAREFTASLIQPGTKVRLETDVEERDRYGRMLAYVYKGRTMVNAKIVEHGHGREMTVPPNVRHSRRFYALMRKAQARRSGIWK